MLRVHLSVIFQNDFSWNSNSHFNSMYVGLGKELSMSDFTYIQAILELWLEKLIIETILVVMTVDWESSLTVRSAKRFTVNACFYEPNSNQNIFIQQKQAYFQGKVKPF